MATSVVQHKVIHELLNDFDGEARWSPSELNIKGIQRITLFQIAEVFVPRFPLRPEILLVRRTKDWTYIVSFGLYHQIEMSQESDQEKNGDCYSPRIRGLIGVEGPFTIDEICNLLGCQRRIAHGVEEYESNRAQSRKLFFASVNRVNRRSLLPAPPSSA